jgi:dienelactone hydrolase
VSAPSDLASTAAGSTGPFFFDAQDRALYGFFHAAEGPPRDAAVLLAQPIGHDYNRSHRAFKHLAQALAAAGFAVLRFDFFGQGDSEGTPGSASLERWSVDLAAAARELRSRSRTSRLHAAGRGLGGALLALHGARVAPFERLALWDTVDSGAAHIDELVAAQRQVERTVAAKWTSAARDAGAMEILGHRFGAGAIAGIRALDAGAPSPAPAAAVVVIATGAAPPAERVGSTWRAAGTPVAYEHLPLPAGVADDPFKPRVPQTVIRAIARFIGGAPS